MTAEVRDEIRRAQWLRHPLVQNVIKALGPNNMRFVGGAVRDSLLGNDVHDIDVATTLLPDDVAERLKLAGVGVTLTGLQHGTVMAHKGAYNVEITTLRSDLETDGRYATVAYIDDWQKDAERRDLTINAIYADVDGQIFDPVGGIEDLKSGHVRFIGDPRKRIEEDALRIMRFFRFYAWFGRGAVSQKELDQIASQVKMIQRLSVERVRDELIKTLSAPSPMSAILLMDQVYLFGEIFGGRPDLATLAHTLQSEDIVPDAMRRLSALLPVSLKAVEDFAARFKLSGLQKKRLLSIAAARIELASNRLGLRAMQYLYGRASLRDAIIIDRPRQLPSWKIVSEVVFPLMGRDLIQLGLEPGKGMGRLLEGAKQHWLDSDCNRSRDELLDHVKAAAERMKL